MHPNATIHTLTWRNKHTDTYNKYQKELMRKVRIWKKIQIEFLSILLTEPAVHGAKPPITPLKLEASPYLP